MGTDDLQKAESFFQKWEGDSLITAAIAPHSVYTCDEKTLLAARKLSDQYNALLMIHAAESKGKIEFSKKKFNKRPVELLNDLGIFLGKTLIADAVWLTDQEMETIKNHSVGIAHCPESNMTLASGIADLDQWLALGMQNIGLGTDGAASNQTLDLFEEMNLAAKLQKVHALQAHQVPAQQALYLATLGGAREIGLEKQVGSLEVGKKADIVVLSTDYPSLQPFYDVYSLIVYAARGYNVDSVIVDGKVLVAGGCVTAVDTDSVKAKVQDYRQRVEKAIR